MLASAIFFFDWPFSCFDSFLKSKSIKEDIKTIVTSQDTLTRHLTNPLFVVVTLFLSFLLLTISFLPVVWFPWVMYLTGDNLKLSKSNQRRRRFSMKKNKNSFYSKSLYVFI